MHNGINGLRGTFRPLRGIPLLPNRCRIKCMRPVRRGAPPKGKGHRLQAQNGVGVTGSAPGLPGECARQGVSRKLAVRAGRERWFAETAWPGARKG